MNERAGITATPGPAPVSRPGALMAAYFGAQFILNFANGAVVNFLLPLSVDIVDPAAKVANLGLIYTVSAVAAVVFQPVWGLLSDGTRTRWGRRTPWILCGLAGTGTMIALFALARSIPALLFVTVALTIAYAAANSPLLAVLADRTPPEKRGIFAALGGLGLWTGVLAGVLAGSAFTARLPLGYLAFGLFTVVAGIPVALTFRRDSRALPKQPRRRTVFWISPRAHPDFAWAFVARVALIAGYSSITAFLLYTLQDYVGLSRDDATALVPVLSLFGIVAVIVASFPGGWLSDRTGRRKPLVIGASILIAGSTVPPVLFHSVAAITASVLVAGLGFGVYLAVDQALMTMVLPRSQDAGKDLGLLNVAQSLGQILAPAIASLTIATAGYQAMFAVAGLFVLAGAAAVIPIRSVR